FRQIYPHLFAGSIYADRLPIGVDSIISNTSHDAIKRFYTDWYRPNLMAIVVVGDISPQKAEQLIKKHFSGLKNPAKERERAVPAIPAYTQSHAQVVTDKEATSYSFIINYSAYKTNPSSTLADYKDDLVKSIFASLLNQRLRELTQKENPPFIFASAGFDSYARGYESFFAQVSTGNKSSLDGLQAFEVELERVKRHGFLKAELDREKTNLLNAIERALKEKDKTESGNYTSEYVSHFLTREPIPGIENEAKYYKELLPAITLEEVNAVAKILENNKEKLVALMGPEAATTETLPTPSQILAVSDAITKMDIKAYEEKEIATNLLEKTPV